MVSVLRPFPEPLDPYRELPTRTSLFLVFPSMVSSLSKIMIQRLVLQLERRQLASPSPASRFLALRVLLTALPRMFTSSVEAAPAQIGKHHSGLLSCPSNEDWSVLQSTTRSGNHNKWQRPLQLLTHAKPIGIPSTNDDSGNGQTSKSREERPALVASISRQEHLAKRLTWKLLIRLLPR